MEFPLHTLDELLNADVWTTGRPGEMRGGTPRVVQERQAIELALRFLCAENGSSPCIFKRLKRPHYQEKKTDYRQRDGGTCSDTWGWSFWFGFPMPGDFEGRSLPVFVNDPSGIVEFSDSW